MIGNTFHLPTVLRTVKEEKPNTDIAGMIDIILDPNGAVDAQLAAIEWLQRQDEPWPLGFEQALEIIKEMIHLGGWNPAGD